MGGYGPDERCGSLMVISWYVCQAQGRTAWGQEVCNGHEIVGMGGKGPLLLVLVVTSTTRLRFHLPRSASAAQYAPWQGA